MQTGNVKGTSRALASRAGASPSIAAQAGVGPSVRFGLGVLLVAIAGYVDAIGYIALGGFFASFISGASISLGVGMSGGQGNAVYEAAILIAAFLAGAIVATVMAEITGVWALPAVLLLEGGLLAGSAVLAGIGWPASVSIFPVVTAMGVQNTVLRPVDGVRLGVTFMTGTLVSLGQGVGRALLGRNRPWSWSPHALLWFAFCVGAAAGGSLYAVFGFVAVSGPAAVVTATAVIVLIVAYFNRRARRQTTQTAHGDSSKRDVASKRDVGSP